MAVKTYYGTCITDATTSAKEVVIRDETIVTDFNIGDLLVVYFKDTNQTAEPTIVVKNDSTEQENSISTDTGKAIKTRSENVDAVGAWDAGETVIFAYTYNVNQIGDNVAYWELINGAPSTENIYGVTKLNGNEGTNISDWLNDNESNSDWNTALTSGMLKKFYASLTKSSGEQPGKTTLQLSWFPAIDTTEDMTELGTLSLTSNKDNGVVIELPLESYIKDHIKQITNTSSLHNDGHSIDDPDGTKENGKFYITNVLPDNRSLWYAAEPNNYEFLVPKHQNSGNLLINSEKTIELNGINGTTIKTGLTLNGNLNMPGKTITSGAINSSGITANGIIDAKGNQIKTTGRLDGGIIYEGNVSLASKYSPIFAEHIFSKVVSIDAGKSSGHQTIGVGKSGFTPVAIAWFNFDYNNQNSTGDAAWCYLWESYLKGDTLTFAIHNTKTKKVNIKASFKVIYVRGGALKSI